jgi:hypothetical protein
MLSTSRALLISMPSLSEWARNDIVRRIGLGQFTREVRGSGVEGATTWLAGLFYMSAVPVGIQKVQAGLAVTPTRAPCAFRTRRPTRSSSRSGAGSSERG